MTSAPLPGARLCIRERADMPHSTKRPVNVKVKADLVSEAEAYGINLSAALEAAVKTARIDRWREENREAFAAYDKRAEIKGVFSAGKRRF